MTSPLALGVCVTLGPGQVRSAPAVRVEQLDAALDSKELSWPTP
ncbi:hypothetical protein [Kocuria sp.]|nr:hypothetical protein [Kocuria sp.]MDO4917914.1 hypothetical protein [Kocuria sp.]